MHYRLNIPSLIMIEQEMELILSRPGAFNTEWITKWVPFIIMYCRGLKRKEVCEIFFYSQVS